MSASAAYYAWRAAGSPDDGLARPLVQLRDLLRTAGWLVYDWPDDAHLQAATPEDHTQFSATGWPGPSPRWWRHAIDIMPDGKGAEALYDLAQAIISDRSNGRITWLKYINSPQARGRLDTAVQDSWEPGHVRSRSSDTGHIHISSVTGCETLNAPYDPFQEVDVSQHTDDVIAAWAVGVKTTPDGSGVAPVEWEIRREARERAADAIQAQTLAAVQTLAKQVSDLSTKVTALSAAVAPAGEVSVTLSGSLSGSGVLRPGGPAGA